MDALQQTINRILAVESEFMTRQMEAVAQLQRLADKRPILEEAYTRAYKMRRDLEAAFAEFQSALQSIARTSELPSHARLLKVLQCSRPSEVFRGAMRSHVSEVALFFEQRTNVQEDANLTQDIASVFAVLDCIVEPPAPKPSRLKQAIWYVGSAAVGAAAASAVTWLWKMRKEAKAKEAKAKELQQKQAQKQLPKANASEATEEAEETEEQAQ